MSSEKKEYPPAGPPSAPTYVSVGGPYPTYPPPAYTSYMQHASAGQPTYLPATYATIPQHHLPYGAVSVNPNLAAAYGMHPAYMPQLAQVYSPRTGTVYVPAAAAYDASARFDGHAMPVVPPPPPGVAPNAAQLAMMQGNPVVLSQQKGSFLSGGSGAGFTFW